MQETVRCPAGFFRVAGKAVSLHQIISCISLFLQEPQNPFDIDVPSAQRGKSVFVQILQVDEGDSVVILFDDLQRISAAGSQMRQIRADLDVAHRKESVDLLRLFRHGPEVRVVACLDAVGGEDLFCLLQPFGQKRIVARLDASPTYGTAAERHVGNAYLFRQSSDCLHVKHLVLQRVWVDKIGAHADAHHAGTVAGQHVFEHLDVRTVFGQVPF